MQAAPIRPLPQQLADCHRLAKGIADSMMEMSGGDMEIVDSKRWDLFRTLLRQADHELGRAVR